MICLTLRKPPGAERNSAHRDASRHYLSLPKEFHFNKEIDQEVLIASKFPSVCQNNKMIEIEKLIWKISGDFHCLSLSLLCAKGIIPMT